MAYIAPIHRPSSVRHALKLRLLSEEEECLVIAKANRLEVWLASSEGLVMAHSKAIYGQISMLEKIRPPNSTRDHLFVGTLNFQYFTACWNADTKQLDTVQASIDVSEKYMRDSQSLDRCLVDPTGQYMVMELFEGVLNLVKVTRPRKGFPNYLDVPDQVRISELNVRASTFLYSESRRPKLALLYEDSYKNRTLRLVTYRLTDEKGHFSQFDAKKDRENEVDGLDPGATLLIPVPKGEAEQKRYIYRNSTSAKAQLGGVLVVGETRILYLDDEAKAKVEYALDEASSFVAWEMYDSTRFLLADEFGWLHSLTVLVDGAVVIGIDVSKIAEISRATTLVYLGNDMLYIGSHEGDSQVVRLDMLGCSLDVLQTMPNIAPILDFEIMDLGSRNGETQSNDYSTGQARLVTGSGCYKTGSLRSMRSGVGLEDIGLLGEMENIKAIFSLRAKGEKYADILLLSFLTETRIFRFDGQGEVEEVEQLLGMSFAEQTLLATNVSQNRILQITASRVAVFDTSCGSLALSWVPPEGEIITAASANQKYILLTVGGRCLLTLDIDGELSEIARQDLGDNDQVACISVPDQHNVGLVGFWQNGSISILNLINLSILHGETLRTSDSAAVPRSIVMTQILPQEISGPTLLVAMSDGIVVTFTVDKSSYALSGKKSVMLGVQHANLQVIPQDQNLCNVFATCEHSSLIYGSEGRIVYSAVTAEDATCISPFDSEAYPDAVVIATALEVKISQIDTQRRTHVRTLPIGETVRRITYSASERMFGLGCIKRELIRGEEFISSSFRLVDEVAFKELGKPFIFDTVDGIEIIECCVRALLPNTYSEPTERFIVGTSYLRKDTKEKGKYNGKIRVMGVNKDRSPYEILSKGLKGACRCLGVIDGKIFAGLVKTVVMYQYTEVSSSSASLEKLAIYRCSTCPIDLYVTDNLVAVGDLMKSMSLIEYVPGKNGEQGELVEVARHFQASFATAVSHIENESYLESDSDGNLVVLRRNVSGVTLEDRQRLEVTSEINLGEMVNRIRKVDVEMSQNANVIPRAFLCTTEGSIYLFGTIAQSAQDLLMRLQSRMAELVVSLGNMPFNKYRAYKAEMRETEEPFRFVDGELIERFLDVSESLQEDICKGLGPTVEDMRSMIEELKRLH